MAPARLSAIRDSPFIRHLDGALPARIRKSDLVFPVPMAIIRLVHRGADMGSAGDREYGFMIRLLCVGLGGMGKHDWSTARASGAFELVAGVDVNEAACAEFRTTTGAPTFPSLTAARQAVKADAALIATPDAFHVPLSIEALEAGLDVICEKPLAETLKDARRMHDTAKRHGKLLMAHQQLRWLPMHHHAKRLVQQGQVGVLRQMEFSMTVFSDACFGGYRSKLPQLILRDLAIHHLDLIRYLSGQDCLSIYARTFAHLQEGVTVPTQTAATAIVELTGPVTAQYRSSMRTLTNQTGYAASVRLIGSKGELLVGYGTEPLQFQSFEGLKAKQAPVAIPVEPPVLSTWQAFGEAMRTRVPTLTDSSDNLKSLAMLFAAIESAETGRVVQPESI
jgi:predicted dehydrogenase